ncbi:regulator of (H+)-ATPase in vacuolar membrane [Conoideocrella luteorostrata]|uniref:Regulator of (H+)-ATPase in vacuolar membrane n=1 Tax=Conoideocrella luteorostrata TaxID=1105319 RepID=A0AAJ0CVA4_9HYPO|nr:regulator of (H+)-ATPase in vacuolar membrane [Conoideocrella luteorostrata]
MEDIKACVVLHIRNLVAQVETGPQHQDHRFVLEDGPTSAFSWVVSNQEPYYSNEDISILHCIVSSAQKQLDRSPYPKPLPAAVLFRAYDGVLPTFGIDPDSDHHLSALVFRVGGEHGNGSLLEKFQAILERMGIVLEFGDNAAASEQAYLPMSLSPMPEPTESYEMHVPQKPETNVTGEQSQDLALNLKSADAIAPAVRNLPASSRPLSQANVLQVSKIIPAAPHRSQDLVEQAENAMNKAEPIKASPRSYKELSTSQAAGIRAGGAIQVNPQKAALVSVVDRWRSVASKNLDVNPTSDHKSFVMGGGRGPQQRSTMMQKAKTASEAESHTFQTQLLLEMGVCGPESAGSDIILRRATRARQLFLASRLFSRWADQTANRLEREYVARRHMVRFRCFNSWTQAPASKLPRARRLKALSAVQKLRRAVASQEEQLELIASVMANAHQKKNIYHVLNYWSSGVSSRSSKRNSNNRKRATAIKCWLKQAYNFEHLRGNVAEISRHSRSVRFATRWLHQAQKHRVRAAATQYFSATLYTLSWARAWQDCAEIGQRAVACRRLQVVEKSEVAFEIWNLRARNQAFRWKCEYISVMKCIDSWIASKLRDSSRQTKSQYYTRARTAVMVIGHMQSVRQTQMELSHLANRAQWYIRANFLVDTLEAVADHRKQQIKLIVRRYLMMRYTQVSSRRRRRGFYKALRHWQSHAMCISKMTMAAGEHQITYDMNRKQAIAMQWRRRTIQAAMSHASAINYYQQKIIDEWGNHAFVSGQRQANASGLWATERQRQSLKAWTISTLQMSGQAHTASMVQQRHGREDRGRSLQKWKQYTGRLTVIEPLPEFKPTTRADPLNSSRTTARSLSKWPPLSRRPEDDQDATSPIQTPSRSTGLPFSVARAPSIRLMDPVEEVDGESALSDTPSIGMTKQTQIGRTSVARPGSMTSTTPRAPVPAHVQSLSPYDGALEVSIKELPLRLRSGSHGMKVHYGASEKWAGEAYISGCAFTVLDEAHRVTQTVYDDDTEKYLDAITIDEASGKIATCTSKQVRIYQPLALQIDNVKWAQQSIFDIPRPTFNAPCTLSWGSSEELLLASNALSLFKTGDVPVSIWEKDLPNPAKLAIISHDSAYVASIGQHDCMTKVWRRLTYAADEVRFDVAYLRHPDIVLSVRWRRPFHPDQAAENVLYTSCLDYLIRIWIPKETTEGQHWQLQGQVDLNQYSVGRKIAPCISLMFIVDGRDFTTAVERAVKDRMTDDESTDDAALDHLVAIANKNPEICVKIDEFGNMVAWALENVGASDCDTFRAFNIAEVKLPHIGIFSSFLSSRSGVNGDHTEVQAYCDRRTGKLHVVLHSFDGRVGVFAANVADFLDPLMNDRRLTIQTVWTGHTAPIEKIVRNFSGHAVVSRTHGGECVLWKHSTAHGEQKSQILSRNCVIHEVGDIQRICVLRKGRFVLFLCSKTVVLWDCRFETASLLAKCLFDLQETPLCLIMLPRPQAAEYQFAYVATITSSGRGVVWEARLPKYLHNRPNEDAAGLVEFCQFGLNTTEKLKYVLPVDPAGPAPAVSGFLDIFTRDVAISYTHHGRVNFWAARVNVKNRSVEWLSTSSTETGLLEPALASGSMLKKAALVNSTRSQITIWDIGGSRLEYEQDYKTHYSIQDLDWTSTPDAQAILAVGFQHRVVLLSQMRFDYLNKGPAWAPIHEINIREFTAHPIGDSVWLANGHLVIGAGNQLFIHDRQLDVGESGITVAGHINKDGPRDLFEAVQRFNGPVAVFHPQFLSQCILAGKGTLVRSILLALYKTLKYIIPGDTIDDYLGLQMSDFYMTNATMAREPKGTQGSLLSVNGNEEDSFTEQTAAAINEKLTKVRIPQLSGNEQIQLADMVECAAFVESHRRSMDENGARFMLFFRQHALRKGRMSEMQLSWREINWAFHSNSQDILLDFISRQNHGVMLWEQAREYGVFMWLCDLTALRDHFEVIARNEYTKGELKDPVECSLFYLALRKKMVLQGLWRMASWNKEQAATQKLLAHNFDDPKWRRTALKNAYALLSKRRFRYAAAFFLLADHLHDAVEVCIRQLKDLQLAIAISRVYEGDGGPVLRRLIQEEVLSVAAREGNRWLASWAFWMLGRKDTAVRALIMPVFALLETPCSPDIKSRMFLTDDPALVVLYSQLRQRTLQTLRGASKVTPKVEWEFVLHSAKLYDRMGCDLLGLDLVRNWEFQQPITVGFGGEVNPLKLLRRRSSLVVDDLSATRRSLGLEQSVDTGKNVPPGIPPATSFVEPDASSLLDSFGL